MISPDDFIIQDSGSVGELFSVLERRVSGSYGSGFALVVDKYGALVGVCTDRDLRNFLAKKARLPKTILEVANKEFFALEHTSAVDNVDEFVMAEFERRGWLTQTPLRLVPVLQHGVPIGVLEVSGTSRGLSKYRDRVVVVGLGYVGLTLACAVASSGFSVHGIDPDKTKLLLLSSGEDYTGEPGVAQLIDKHKGRNLHFHSGLSELPEASPGRRDVFILCVGTPLSDNFEVDESFLDRAVDDVSQVMSRNSLLIIRSTVTVGATRRAARHIANKRGWIVGDDFYVASAPERTVEGDALNEIRRLPQLLAGVTDRCSEQVVAFFSQFSDHIVPLGQVEAAELGKLASNAFRDYVFSFSNRLASICREYEVDVNQLIDKINSGYSRNSIPDPSPGVGGPCLSKDSWLLENLETSAESPIVAARLANQKTESEIVKFLVHHLSSFGAKQVLGLGLAFKGQPATPDLRVSPGLKILSQLESSGYEVWGWDAIANVESSGIRALDDEFLGSAFLVLNNHPRNLEKLGELVSGSPLESALIFDPWRLVSPEWIDNGAFSSIKFKILSLSSVVRELS